MKRGVTRRRLAFSAVEVLIVLTIIGLVAGFSMPRIGVVVAQDRVRRAQYVVGSYVEMAFQYAARVRKPMTITLNSSTKVFAITNRSDGSIYRQIDLSQSGPWALTDAAFSPVGGITIFPTGLASSGLRISLSNNDFSKTINATIAGQVTKN